MWALVLCTNGIIRGAMAFYSPVCFLNIRYDWILRLYYSDVKFPPPPAPSNAAKAFNVSASDAFMSSSGTAGKRIVARDNDNTSQEDDGPPDSVADDEEGVGVIGPPISIKITSPPPTPATAISYLTAFLVTNYAVLDRAAAPDRPPEEEYPSQHFIQRYTYRHEADKLEITYGPIRDGA